MDVYDLGEALFYSTGVWKETGLSGVQCGEWFHRVRRYAYDVPYEKCVMCGAVGDRSAGV